MNNLDPKIKEAIDILCNAIELDSLFTEMLFMNPEHDKDNIYQCTQELMKKHDLNYIVKFIHAVQDSNFEGILNHWMRVNDLSNIEAKAQFYEMMTGLRDFKDSDYKI
jgi:hypothetical protein